MKNLTNCLFRVLYLILIIQSIDAYAQTRIITGTVKNAITGLPISGITVAAKDMRETTTSNSSGEYALAIPDSTKNVAFAEFAGMNIMEIKIVNYDVIDIYLCEINMPNLSLEELMKIKVTTAGKQEQQISDIPASVVIYTRNDIKKYGYRNILSILENIPGLFANKGYYKEGIGVRGFYAEDNIVYMINGINQFELPIVPIESIERIEVIKGPMSVIYGTGAFFGAINIITTGKQSYISVSNENIGATSVSSKFVKYRQDYGVSVNTNYSHSSGLDVPYEKLIINPSRLPLLGVSTDATTKNQMERNTLYFNVSSKFDHFYTDMSFIQDYRESLYFYPTVGDGSLVKKSSNYFTLGYKNEVFSFLSIDAKFDYYKRMRNFKFQFNVDTTIIKNFNKLNHYTEEYKESRVVGEIDLFWKIHKDINVITGFYSRIELEGTNAVDIPFWGPYLTNSDLNFISPGDVAPIIAGFVQTNIKISNKLKGVIGGRAEKMLPFDVSHQANQASSSPTSYTDTYKGSKTGFVPRVAIIYTPTNHHVFKLLYGEAIHYSSVKDLYSDLWAIYSTPGIKKEPLQPEFIRTYELNYSSLLINRHFAPSISIFRNEFRDMITKTQIFNSSNGIYYWLFQNYGKMVTNGIELSLSAEPIKRVHLEVSGTYQKSEDQRTVDANGNKVNVGNSPQYLGYGKLSFELKKITLATNVTYVDKMDAAWNDKNKTRQAEAVPSYWNAACNFRINDIYNGIFAALSISNIFNTEIRYISGSDEFTQRGYIGEPRTLSLTIGYKFDSGK